MSDAERDDLLIATARVVANHVLRSHGYTDVVKELLRELEKHPIVVSEDEDRLKS